MERKEDLFTSLLRRLKPDSLGLAGEPFSQRARDFRFAMKSNGYSLLKNGQWSYSPQEVKPFLEEFRGQQVSFFGPGGTDKFFSYQYINEFTQVIHALEQKSVTDVIRKYREVDENQAARIAFLFGGIVRHKASQSLNSDKDIGEIANAVNFAAKMTMLGNPQSGDAIASAISMYIISGGSLDENSNFTRQIHQMSEAVREDPIKPLQTTGELGLSQVARMRTFLDKIQGKESPNFPDTEEYEEELDGFPTVGAEFHFSPSAPNELPYFWQRLAILNMSQYQRGSYIQLSRNDRDIIEVRMNPSIYPITIANWNHIRLLLPELNHTFFTITLNRKNEGNFYWNKGADKTLLNKLRTLGMLSYAGMFENIPASGKKEEVNFGSVYLGQTVRVQNGEYNFTGHWNGGEGNYGQMGIYAGFGDNLPYLAFYLSMALANPNILDSIPKSLFSVKTLNDALSLSPNKRKMAFMLLQNRISAFQKLNKANIAGNKIMNLLNP